MQQNGFLRIGQGFVQRVARGKAARVNCADSFAVEAERE
jgi:hypothetical protein